MRLFAYAKINLFLDVGPKENSANLHKIRSLFQTVSLRDTIYLSEAKEDTIESAGFDVPEGKENIVYKAIKLFKSYTKEKRAVKVRILKRIPIGAGLGGGSSDAAAVLKGLNHIWRKNLSMQQLSFLSKTIGSDVVFFLFGGTAWVEGTGEQIYPILSIGRRTVLITKPDFSIPTKEIYQMIKNPSMMGFRERVEPFDLIKRVKSNLTVKLDFSKISFLRRRFLYNRLSEFVFLKYPVLKKIQDRLIECGADLTLLSGTGSALFSLVKDRKEAEGLIKELKKRFENLSFWLVHTV